MQFYKKILILLIIVIFTYILFRIFQKRFHIIHKINSQEKEGFISPSATNEEIELELVTNKENVTINSINDVDTNLRLNQFIIKASYNSAFTGNYINNDMIKYVLSRGCRFLDFEVFYIKNKPFVAYSTDSSYKTIDSKNQILLNDILTTVVSNAFSDNSPNNRDPVFVHLRVKSNDNNIYKDIAKSIDATLKDKLYFNTKIDNDTKLTDIMGKVIIVMDKTINYKYNKYTSCAENEENCYDLTKYINIESGGDLLGLQRYTTVLNQKINPPYIHDDNITVSANRIHMALPDYDTTNTSNPNYGVFVRDYGYQIVPYRFYKKDKELSNYEDFFNDNKYGIVPISKAIRHYEKLKEEENSA